MSETSDCLLDMEQSAGSILVAQQLRLLQATRLANNDAIYGPDSLTYVTNNFPPSIDAFVLWLVTTIR